jgi:predicted phage terminase large subunit-like protein
MFSIAEIREYLSSPKTENKIKLTRKEFLEWLEDYSASLRETIKSNNLLPRELREDRLTRAEKDFAFFFETYLPHYKTNKGECVFHNDLDAMFTSIASGENKGQKIAIAAPRGYGKTTKVSVAFPLWCVLFAKKRFIVEISDAVELTEINIESIKAELEDNERIAQDFQDAAGIGSVWRIGDIVTANGMKIKGYGSAKRLRGAKHGIYRPDLVIIDDLENDSAVRSLEQRNKLEQWLDDAVLNLGTIDGTLDTLMIGTILHRDSVLSRKLDSGFWTAKKYQALITPPDRSDLWENYAAIYKSQGKEAAHNYYVNNQAAMTAGSKILWEAAGLENVMRLKIESPRAFAKEQQNNPISESSRFLREKMHFWSSLPSDLSYFGWCDPAGFGKKSDFTSFCVLGVSQTLRKGFVIESINRVMPSAEIIKTALNLQSAYKLKRFGFETNGGQFHLKSWLASAAFDSRIILPVVGVHNTRPKQERIEELELPIENGEILLHSSQAILIEQLEEFPEAKNDDAPDALHGAYSLSKLSKLKNVSRSRHNVARVNPRRRNR